MGLGGAHSYMMGGGGEDVAQEAQQVFQRPKGWWLKSCLILVHPCVLGQVTEPVMASNRAGSAWHTTNACARIGE